MSIIILYIPCIGYHLCMLKNLGHQMVLNWIKLLENISLITYGPIYNASNLVGSSNLRASWTMTHILSNSICLRWHLSNATFRHCWIASTCWAASWHPSFRASNQASLFLRNCKSSKQCSIVMHNVCISNLIGRMVSIPYIKENGVARVVTL